MSKKYYSKRGINLPLFRERERGELLRKYYDLFYSKMKIEGDLTEQDKDFLIYSLYYYGKICITKRIDGKPLLCPFAPSSWNNEDFPVDIQYINKRGLPGIFPPSMKGQNLVDCVIGYIRPSKNSVYEYVEHQVDKIVDIVMVMKINEFVLKMPYVFGISSEDKMAGDTIIKQLENDEPVIFANLNEANNLQVLQGGVFNLDKLREEKEALENELKTQLGINNNNNNRKRERQTTTEVEANNDEIETSSNVYMTPLEAFSKQIKETLGFNIKIEWFSPMTDSKEYEEEEEQEDDEQL